ncbi:MAG: rod-binding protein [Planctomycetes bacterium]|nr:rod-binding protein [Planctomycetota bacterium]
MRIDSPFAELPGGFVSGPRESSSPTFAAELGLARRADGSVDARQASQKFEAVFTSMLLSQMRQASDLHFFGESPGSQVYEGLFDQLLGDALAANGGLGVAASLERSIGEGERAREQANALGLLHQSATPEVQP